MVCHLWLYCMSFGEFQAFITDFILMTKHRNNVKLSLPLHNTKVGFSTVILSSVNTKEYPGMLGYLPVMINNIIIARIHNIIKLPLPE